MYITNVLQTRGFSEAESRDLCQQVSEGAFLPVRACYPIRSAEQREGLGIQSLLNMRLQLQEERQSYGFAERLRRCCIYQNVIPPTLGEVLLCRTVWIYRAVSKMQHKIHFSCRSGDRLTLTAAPDESGVEVRRLQAADLAPPRLKESRYGRQGKNHRLGVNMSLVGICCRVRLVSIKEATRSISRQL